MTAKGQKMLREGGGAMKPDEYYARCLKWLAKIQNLDCEARYSGQTPSTVLADLKALLDDAKADVADALQRLNAEILKGGK